MKRSLACIVGLLVHSSAAHAQQQAQATCGTPTTPPCQTVSPGTQQLPPGQVQQQQSGQLQQQPPQQPNSQQPNGQQPNGQQPNGQQPYVNAPYQTQPYQPLPTGQPTQQAPLPGTPCNGPGQPACVGPTTGPQSMNLPPPVVVTPKPEDKKRSDGSMTYLIGTSIGVGVGTGVWIDELAKVDNPGVAVIAPAILATALPIGVYLWDNADKFDKGVPASMATGFILGASEGITIAAAAELNTSAGNGLGLTTDTTISWLTMVAGGVGGFFFGDALKPDPRSNTFIVSGAAWGYSSFALIGAGAASSDKWAETGSVLGVIGLNVGIASTVALSTFYTPSYETQKYMWAGYGIGTVGSSLVYIFYLFSNSDAKGGLIANGVGGLAGLGIAAALTADLKDDDDEKKTAWKAPFDLGMAPPPKLNNYATSAPSGMMFTAKGTW